MLCIPMASQLLFNFIAFIFKKQKLIFSIGRRGLKVDYVLQSCNLLLVCNGCCYCDMQIYNFGLKREKKKRNATKNNKKNNKNVLKIKKNWVDGTWEGS